MNAPKLPQGMPQNIYFFRHGESEGNARGLDDESLHGFANHRFPLTERGRAQARLLSEYVHDLYLPARCTEAYVSSFARTAETLDLVLAGVHLPIYEDSRLDEWWKGIFHSMRDDERARVYPAEQATLEREGWHHYRPPQGEAGKDVESRLLSFFPSLSGMPVISGHGRVGGFLDRLLCNRKLDLDCSYEVPKNCELWLFSKRGPRYERQSLFVP
jgi:broad specificity phosphatase PhoE